MKKCMLTTLFCLALLAALSAHAQTTKETVGFFDAKLHAYTDPRQFPELLKIAGRDDIPGLAFIQLPRRGTRSDPAQEISHDLMSLKDATSVTVTTAKRYMNGEPFDVIAIILTGPYLTDCANGTCTKAMNLAVDLKADTPKPEVDRIVKAFTHLATLAGAKLVDDTLFK